MTGACSNCPSGSYTATQVFEFLNVLFILCLTRHLRSRASPPSKPASFALWAPTPLRPPSRSASPAPRAPTAPGMAKQALAPSVLQVLLSHFCSCFSFRIFALGFLLLDRLSDRLSDTLSDRLSDRLSDQLSDRLSDRLSDQLSDQLSDTLSDLSSRITFRIHFWISFRIGFRI